MITGPSLNSGYFRYTVRVGGVDTTSLNDVRVLRWTGSSWVELPRDVVDPGTAASDVRFMLQSNVPAFTPDDSYWLYFGSSGSPPNPGLTSVYLWWDDASMDRESLYVQGRVDDSAHGSAWANSVSWNSAGYYDYSTNNDFADSLRPQSIGEADIYVEFEFFHTNSWPDDMTSGPIARLSGTGSGGGEISDGHYYYELADSSQQGGVYASHDDITHLNRGNVVVTSSAMGPVPNNIWMKAGLAVWGANPTNLKAWFDASVVPGRRGSFGVPPRFGGTHAAANQTVTPGQAGAWLQQEAGRIRNLLIRRYTEPEPTTSLGPEEWNGSRPSGGGENPNGDNYIGETCGGSTAALSGPAMAAIALLWLALSAFRRR